jgi:hypothetical protein
MGSGRGAQLERILCQMRTIDIPNDFMADRPMNDPPRESAIS